MKVLAIILMLIATLPGFAAAGDAFTLNFPEQKSLTIGKKLFNRLYREANEQKAISKKDFKQQLIDSLLLSNYASVHYPQLNLATNVGYDPKLTQDLQINKTLMRWFKFEAKKAQTAATQYMHFELTPEQLNNAIGKPSILGYELTKKQRLKAQAVVVGQINLPIQKTISITLAELYQSQSVQGRIPFHQGDIDTIKRYAYDRFFVYYHQFASTQHNDFSSQDLTALKAIVQAKYTQPLLMLAIGARTSEHGDDKGLEAFKQQVTNEQIDNYYQQNRENFRHIAASQARLLHFDSEQQAKQAIKKLKSDNNWHEIAQSLQQSGWFPGHKDGWIAAKTPQQHFLTTLAMALPEGQINPAIRGPNGQWHVVKVEQKRYGYFPKDSETVVYQATNTIAKRLAQQSFKQLKQTLLNEVTIDHHES